MAQVARSVTLAEFLRAYAVRTSQVMWFLGAGASAAAGVPTAEHMIWEFKREIYVSREKRSHKALDDLASSRVRSFLQGYFDRQATYPAPGAADEYAKYFELCYPNEADRRAYIDGRVRGGRPSFGHSALARLISGSLCEVVWTTNFDRTIEDAVATVLGTTSSLRVATTETHELAAQAISERSLPLLVKLHGDFHSRALKNTTAELRDQDAQLRRAFVQELQRRGLAVVGYSGRDDSVMAALEEAAEKPGAMPGGLFWFHRADATPSDRVQRMIVQMNERGSDAALVPIGAFDEVMGDVARHLRLSVAGQSQTRRRMTSAPIPDVAGIYPALRFNALPIARWPQTARLIVCDIGNTREVRDTIVETGASVVAVRTSAGVVGFGRDGEFDKMLAGRKVTHRDLHAIELSRLRSDSSELGLLLEAACAALCRSRPVALRQRSWRRYLVPSDENHELVRTLRNATGSLQGTIARTNLQWYEAAHLRLDRRLGRLWLVFEPTVFCEEGQDESLRARRADFVRERLAGRYNSKVNELIIAWTGILAGTSGTTVLRAFGIEDGVDAEFEVSTTTAFSWRQR